ncbi:hypothetical protein [Desulforhopalus vacuolatus]|nr:hypothetical protein [Desulforhopalus vacuolatus]
MPCLHDTGKRNNNGATGNRIRNTDNPRNIHATLSPRGDNGDLTHHQ